MVIYLSVIAGRSFFQLFTTSSTLTCQYPYYWDMLFSCLELSLAVVAEYVNISITWRGNRLMSFFTKGRLWAGGSIVAVSVSFSLLLDDV